MCNGTVISDIVKTKKGRFSLFSGGEFLFSIDGETLLKNKIEISSSLSSEELVLLKSASDSRRAKDKALNFISLRDHGGEELYKKLVKTFDEYTARYAVDEMKRLGLVNDEAFAQHRAKHLIEVQRVSMSAAKQKLRALGLDKEIIAQALEQCDDEGELANVKALIAKKYARKLAAEQGYKKVAATLMRLGFSYGVVKQALAEAGEELPPEQSI